jgi:hypothetical protein
MEESRINDYPLRGNTIHTPIVQRCYGAVHVLFLKNRSANAATVCSPTEEITPRQCKMRNPEHRRRSHAVSVKAVTILIPFDVIRRIRFIYIWQNSARVKAKVYHLTLCTQYR